MAVGSGLELAWFAVGLVALVVLRVLISCTPTTVCAKRITCVDYISVAFPSVDWIVAECASACTSDEL